MFKSRKSLGMAGLLAVAGLTLAGCASAEEAATEEPTTEEATTEEATTEEAAAEEFEVYALFPQGNDQAYGSTLIEPLQENAAALGINITLTNSGYDAVKQQAECETAVAAQPDGIMLWPAVSDAVRPCLVLADNAGIPVWVINTDVGPADAPLTYGYSGPDTYGQGKASAELMCEAVGDEEVNIIQVNGAAGNGTAIDRDNGFTDHVEANCPNVTIVAEQNADWTPAGAQQVAAEMLAAEGVENIGGIYAADDSMVDGAVKALEALGEDASEYYITGIGNTVLGNPLVKEGKMYGTVFQSSGWEGENAPEYMHRVLTGEIAKGDRVTAYMPSVKVTAENADDPEVAPEW
jgi:ribose transport system substrate-binding protein